MKLELHNNKKYSNLLKNIGETYNQHQNVAVSYVNRELLKAYWKIGQYIIEFEQAGQVKAEYGKKLLVQLSKDLKIQYGKGFSRTNLVYMRLFYSKYKISQTVSDQLSWSHYVELLGISDDLERNFYEKQSIHEKWSVRELKRQKKSALYHRLAMSKDKEGILEMSRYGHIIQKPEDLNKDPYVFEFLGLPESNLFSESELEKRLLNQLQDFLLELGKGFAFISQQHRITLNNKHFKVDFLHSVSIRFKWGEYLGK